MRLKWLLMALLLAFSGVGCGDDNVGTTDGEVNLDTTDGVDQVDGVDTDMLDDDVPVGPDRFHVVALPLAGAGATSGDRFEVRGGILSNTPSYGASIRFTVFPVIGARR